MHRTATPLTIASLIVSGVGLVDAGLGRVWDLFVIFLAVIVLQVLALMSTLGNRVSVTLRPDLARWATQRSQRTGEPVEDVIDRSVAWFQHGLHRSSQADGN